MSEYQYYEFQALDRPLSHEAQAEMRRLSSRVRLTATSASFVYNYSDFPGSLYRVLAKHFDAMLYITNWGTRQLMFRFPARAIPNDVMSVYQYADSVEWFAEGEYVILNIEINEEDDYGEWIEGEGTLSGIVQARNDILRGDYRALYLAWLMIAECELAVLKEDEDLTEPPVPPNLQELSPALRNFIDFFRIDPDLVAVASQSSLKVQRVKEKLSASIDRLSEIEKRDFLERLLNGESYLDIALANRLREFSSTDKAELPESERRTIRQIFAEAKAIKQKRLEVERQREEAARLKKLGKVAQQQAQLWARIHDLIGQKKTSAYDEAVNILKDLRDLAIHQQRMDEFRDEVSKIRSRHPTLQGLHRRLQEAGLG